VLHACSGWPPHKQNSNWIIFRPSQVAVPQFHLCFCVLCTQKHHQLRVCCCCLQGSVLLTFNQFGESYPAYAWLNALLYTVNMMMMMMMMMMMLFGTAAHTSNYVPWPDTQV
jgi:hypothetical protein